MNNIKYESPEVHMDVFDVAKLSKGSKLTASQVDPSFEESLEELKDGEILEALGELEIIESATAGLIGAGISFAIYKAVKELLHLEGARRRGDIKNSEIIERVSKIAWDAGKKGVAVGAVLVIAVMIFGSSILVPLSILSPFIGIQMAASLWQAFWQGLDETQKQELRSAADEIGGKIKNFFAELDSPEENHSKAL
ncbi:hypothetical protein [Mastigocoleus sp. MO_188.B34]|uniref:hypothetical protein n=1 Tax=Mastigocoleus sp. MO_188.B34 TaxID=3036635 RepID=UPI002610E6B0|nr:hypothetical protein [Mastigocoleus sp. MO_188.B34]MDJ0696996.1 hypothetical protein [Mastigocoleus sp. MO_188.B34]